MYSYTPFIWPSVLTVLLLVALSVYGWRRRSVPGALPFAIAGLLFALWMAGYTLVIAATDAAGKIFWLKFGGVWQMFGVTAVICFLLEYAWPGRWLTRRNLALLSIPPLLIMGLILTNDLHHLMWRGFVVDRPGITVLLGPAGRVAVAYGVGLVLVNLAVFAWLFVRSPQHRWPVVLMLTGQIAGRAAYVAHVGQIIESDLPLNVLATALLFVMYAIALFSFRLFDPIAMARQRAIEQLHAGMLVLDPQGRVISLNPGAGRILGRPAGDLKGRRIGDLLPAYPDRPLDETGETEIEFCLPESHSPNDDAASAGPAVRHYILAISPLQDWRGVQVGRLLLLRDVTAQKQAQAQILEQQRALATLQERERLARELHDSLGQTLAAAHLQASSARLLLARGETAGMDECLKQMADMTIAAEADVREYLLAAKTAFSAGLPFFPALQKYLARFSQQYGLRVELSVPPRLEAGGLGPAVELQLLRIIQEALSNVRKHARASSAQVVFTVSGPLVQAAIRDDGQGFDPTSVAARQAEGFGLQAMRERAEALGGHLQVISRPGQGTEVMVQMPVNGPFGQ